MDMQRNTVDSCLIMNVNVGVAPVTMSWSNAVQKKKAAPSTIVVEGNIGSGKSSLLRRLDGAVLRGGSDAGSSPRNVVTFQEPVESWTHLLELAEGDRKRWSFTLQMAVIAGLLDREKTISAFASEASKDNVVVVLERDIQSGHAFMEVGKNNGDLTDLEYDLGKSMIARHKQVHLADVMVYLYCGPKMCLARIKSRGRAGEQGLSLAYLEDLDAALTATIGTRSSQTKCLVLNTETLSPDQVLSAVVEGIEHALYN